SPESDFCMSFASLGGAHSPGEQCNLGATRVFDRFFLLGRTQRDVFDRRRREQRLQLLEPFRSHPEARAVQIDAQASGPMLCNQFFKPRFPTDFTDCPAVRELLRRRTCSPSFAKPFVLRQEPKLDKSVVQLVSILYFWPSLLSNTINRRLVQGAQV